MNKARVLRVPECGYVVIGDGTYSEEEVVDVSAVDPGEIQQLEKEGFIEQISDDSFS
jgi:hypothetical protein